MGSYSGSRHHLKCFLSEFVHPNPCQTDPSQPKIVELRNISPTLKVSPSAFFACQEEYKPWLILGETRYGDKKVPPASDPKRLRNHSPPLASLTGAVYVMLVCARAIRTTSYSSCRSLVFIN